MEQNASGGLTSTPPPRKSSGLLPIIIIIVVVLSIIISVGYFFYARARSSNFSNSDNVANTTQSSDENIDSSWEEFIYEDASIKFSHPDNLTAVVIDSGLSISMEGETIMNIKYDRLNSESLSDYVNSNSDSEPEIIQLDQKTGLGTKVGNINYQYYPTYFDNYIVIETFEVDNETQQTLDQMIQTIEFIAPLASED